MTNLNTKTTGLPPVPIYFKRNWGWLLALGVLFEIAGLVSLGLVISVTILSMFFIGAIILVAAVFQIVDVFQSKNWKGAAWHFLTALLYIVIGASFIIDPFLASVIVTAILAWSLIIMGIARFFMAFSLRGSEGWGWILFAGIASFILGIMILMQWPASGLWIIGLLIAVELIMYGWTCIFMALSIRNS